MRSSSADPPSESDAVTRFRAAIEQGEPQAAEQLLPLVYDELRRLARARLASEASGQTLQATALVHEAYLRLVGRDPGVAWDGRGHFSPPPLRGCGESWSRMPAASAGSATAAGSTALTSTRPLRSETTRPATCWRSTRSSINSPPKSRSSPKSSSYGILRA